MASLSAAHYLLAALVGLVCGSFLNVVIHRLPKMLEADWRKECAQLLGMKQEIDAPPYNLMVPGSSCPACGHRLSALENIPVLSYLWLRGRCAACHQPISIRYPLIELLAAGLVLICLWRFGVGWQALAAGAFALSLLALTAIDLQHQLLPDTLTLPLLWAGLVANLHGLFVPLPQAVIGAVTGYLALWLVFHLFRLLTGKEGMGYGDFKLLAALGAWVGWKMLPLILLIASASGALVGLVWLAWHGRSHTRALPFGPYLAAAGFIALGWGPALVHWYLGSLR